MDAVPAWLLTEERYTPRPDKDAFLDRSILRFLKVLARGRTRAGREAGGRAEPLVKVLCLLVAVLLLSLTRSPAFLALAATGLLAALALQDGRLIARVLKTSLAVAAFTVLILLPTLAWGRVSAALLITAKVALSVALVKLVSATADWASLSGVFKRLGAPDLFLLVFDIALKYITLLGEFALAMLYALKLRSVGRNAGKAASLGGIAGTLFLKSKEMAEDMYGAMECRGFTGQYRPLGRLRLGWRDVLLGGATGLLLALFLLTRVR